MQKFSRTEEMVRKVEIPNVSKDRNTAHLVVPLMDMDAYAAPFFLSMTKVRQ